MPWEDTRSREMGNSRRAQLHPGSRLFPALVVFLLILQLVVPYRGWRMMLFGLGGAWLLSYLWARSLARGLRLMREMRFGWVQVGDRLVERFTLSNDGWAPALWVELVDQSTLPDYQVGRGTRVGSRRSVRWHTDALCTRRGLYSLGPARLETGDPFGLFTVSLDYPASLPLLVLPPIVPLPSVQVAPGGWIGEGLPRTNALERTVSAASVREYAPGDGLRWIHWRTSARQDNLFVRLFDGTSTGDWWIILDMNRRVQVGEGQDGTEEHGVILAASLADRGLRLGRAVGLVAGGEPLVWLPPREGEPQRWQILRSLAQVSLGSRPLPELLVHIGSEMRRRASLIIITPQVDSVWVDALLLLVRCGAVPTVLLLDPISFGGSGNIQAARMALTDMGVTHYVVARDLLDRPEARPAYKGDAEGMKIGPGWPMSFRQTPGRAWRVLST